MVDTSQAADESTRTQSVDARFSHGFWAVPFMLLCAYALIGSQGTGRDTELDAMFAAVLISPLPLLLLRLATVPKGTTQWCLVVFVLQAALCFWTVHSTGLAGIPRRGPFFPLFWLYALATQWFYVLSTSILLARFVRAPRAQVPTS
jgi:hypothetical protein